MRAILEIRHETGRGTEYIHYILSERKGLSVSLSSVKRTLKRNNLTKYSKWKKWHSYLVRPLVEQPGSLVEVDTVHRIYAGRRLYVYTLLDVYSRWAYASAIARIGADPSAVFVRRAAKAANFGFETVQSDHGSEFSKWFTKKLAEKGIAHLERFNRTIQEECIARPPGSVAVWNKELPKYLHHYNHERPHMGIDWKTPMEMLQN